MSLLNIALQNCALELPECSKDVEKLIARCNGMQAVREATTINQALVSEWATEWATSVKILQDMIGSRFRRLSLKD